MLEYLVDRPRNLATSHEICAALIKEGAENIMQDRNDLLFFELFESSQ